MSAGLPITDLDCKSCAFFVEVGAALRNPDTGDPACPGECHRYAPQTGTVTGVDTGAGVHPDETANADWPRVWEDDFCGDHSDVGTAGWADRLNDRRVLANWIDEGGTS